MADTRHLTSELDSLTAQRELLAALRARGVFRRDELSARQEAAFEQLLANGEVRALVSELYCAPRPSAFGPTPPSDLEFARGFVGEDDVLVMSPSVYNGLGVGTTQLYNATWVYNHHFEEVVRVGNREYEFRKRAAFPNQPTVAFLLVDLLNNLGRLAEDQESVRARVRTRLLALPKQEREQALQDFATPATQELVRAWVEDGFFASAS